MSGMKLASLLATNPDIRMLLKSKQTTWKANMLKNWGFEQLYNSYDEGENHALNRDFLTQDMQEVITMNDPQSRKIFQVAPSYLSN